MSESEALPEGWEMVRLSDVGTFRSGSGFPLNAQGKTTGRYPFFKVSDFSNQGNDRTLNRANHYIDESDRQRIGARVFQPDTIAFAKIGAAIFLERKRLIEQESCLDNNMAGYTLQNERVSRDLILANLQQFSLGSLVASTALPAIGSGELNSIAFPMPSSPDEQQAIAAALSDADGVVAGLERVTAKKRLIKQGAMQDLLTARRRLPGFSGEWEEATLSELADIRSGGTPSTSDASLWDGDIAWVTPTDITALDGRKFLLSTSRTISRAGLRQSSAELLPEGTIVMTSRATIGECAIATIPLTTNQGFKNFIPKDRADRDFLYYLLMSLKKGFIELCSGSTFLEIGKTQLTGYTVRVPETKKEQEAIAAVLSDMDAEIQTLESRLAKARAVKEGMMQNLLTGRVRLV